MHFALNDHLKVGIAGVAAVLLVVVAWRIKKFDPSSVPFYSKRRRLYLVFWRPFRARRVIRWVKRQRGYEWALAMWPMAGIVCWWAATRSTHYWSGHVLWLNLSTNVIGALVGIPFAITVISEYAERNRRRDNRLRALYHRMESWLVPMQEPNEAFARLIMRHDNPPDYAPPGFSEAVAATEELADRFGEERLSWLAFYEAVHKTRSSQPDFDRRFEELLTAISEDVSLIIRRLEDMGDYTGP